MKKILTVIMVVMLAVGMMAPAFASAESVVGHDEMWVKTRKNETLNIREKPTKDSAVLYRVNYGEKLFIVEATNSIWAKVYQDGKVTGYAMVRFLTSRQPNKYEITEKEVDFEEVSAYNVKTLARSKRTDTSVGLRTKPNKSASMIRRLYAGETLTVIAVGKTWSMVKDPKTGRTGYVANDYIVKI